MHFISNYFWESYFLLNLFNIRWSGINTCIILNLLCRRTSRFVIEDIILRTVQIWCRNKVVVMNISYFGKKCFIVSRPLKQKVCIAIIRGRNYLSIGNSHTLRRWFAEKLAGMAILFYRILQNLTRFCVFIWKTSLCRDMKKKRKWSFKVLYKKCVFVSFPFCLCKVSGHDVSFS